MQEKVRILYIQVSILYMQEKIRPSTLNSVKMRS